MSELQTPIIQRPMCFSRSKRVRLGEGLGALHDCDLAHSVLHVFLESAVGRGNGQQDAVDIGLTLGEGVGWVRYGQKGDGGGRSKAHGGHGV